jgi:acyl carrier protein
VVTTQFRCTPGAEPAIGHANDGTRLHLLDDAFEPVPAGVVGEIYIAGAGVARGYRGRPAETAAVFLPDPWGGPGARLYRSGDLGRRRQDGALLFLRRRDPMIKLRGVRIEPGEVEAALLACRGVREAAVTLVPDPGTEGAGGGRKDHLLACIVPGEELSLAALQEELRARLPRAMVPTHFALLDTLPKNHSGKLDRRALASAARPATPPTAPAAAPSAPPESAAEAHIAAVWARHLGVETVGIEDNFFDLGGHSLLLIEIHRELERDFPVALVDLMQFPTVRSLARHVESQPPAGEPQDARPPEAESGSNAATGDHRAEARRRKAAFAARRGARERKGS